MYLFNHLFIYPFIYLFNHSLVPLFIRLFIYPLIYSFIFIDSFIYSFVLLIHLSLSLTGLPVFWYRLQHQKARTFKNDKLCSIWKEATAAKLQPVLTNWSS